MSNKEALEIVLELANAHPAVDAGVDDTTSDPHNAIGLTVKEKEALDHAEDYILDVEQDDVLKWMNKLGLDSDFKKKED